FFFFFFKKKKKKEYSNSNVKKNILLPVKYEYYLQYPHAQMDVSREALIYVTGYLMIAAWFGKVHGHYLYHAWIEPSLIGQIFLRLYLIAEHNGCQFGELDMWKNTRSTKTWFFVRKLAWNMPYHLEHHAYPFVPFHQLPAVHEIIVNHLLKDEEQKQKDVVFYEKSQCKPNGKGGYLSMHLHYIRNFLGL
ncbi:rhizopine catabolism protein mocD, partial [Reticulomyxa filosa]